MDSLTTFLIGAFLFSPCLIALWMAIRAFRQWEADKAVERFNKATRFNPTREGNYPAFYNHKTGGYFAPAPGNRPFSENYIIHNGIPKPLQEGQGRTLIVNTSYRVQGQGEQLDMQAGQSNIQGRKMDIQGELQGEQLDRQSGYLLEEGEFRELPTPDPARTVAENRELLYTLKQKGIGKIQAIKSVTGIKSQSSATYKTYSQIWEELPGPDSEN